jgi:hypothetical protein
VSIGPSALVSLKEVAPFDHIAFGSDWPFARRLFEVSGSEVPDWATDLVPSGADPAPMLGQLSTEDRVQVDRGTAETLIPRLRVERAGGV